MVRYGERYSDNSGWERKLEIDITANVVDIDLVGAHVAIQLEDLWWLVKHALVAREALGMDKLESEGPVDANDQG